MLISYRQKNPSSWPKVRAVDKEERLLANWCERFRKEQNLCILEKGVQQQLTAIGFGLSSVHIIKWHESLERLKQHLNDNGGIDKQKDLKIHQWAYRQANSFELLNADQQRQLDLVGLFEYVKNNEVWWNKMFEDVRAFVQEFNKFPSTHKKVLWSWLKGQTNAFNAGTLDLKRKGMLDTIGFKFETPKNTDWEVSFQKVTAFKQTNKKWPSYFSVDEQEKKMYLWCQAQRQTYQGTVKGKRLPLKPEYITKLNSIGFHWSNKELTDANWEDMYKKTLDYIMNKKKDSTETIKISTLKEGTSNKIYNWIRYQQMQISKEILEPEKVEKMKAIFSLLIHKIS